MTAEAPATDALATPEARLAATAAEDSDTDPLLFLGGTKGAGAGAADNAAGAWSLRAYPQVWHLAIGEGTPTNRSQRQELILCCYALNAADGRWSKPVHHKTLFSLHFFPECSRCGMKMEGVVHGTEGWLVPARTLPATRMHEQLMSIRCHAAAAARGCKRWESGGEGDRREKRPRQ